MSEEINSWTDLVDNTFSSIIDSIGGYPTIFMYVLMLLFVFFIYDKYKSFEEKERRKYEKKLRKKMKREREAENNNAIEMIKNSVQ